MKKRKSKFNYLWLLTLFISIQSSAQQKICSNYNKPPDLDYSSRIEHDYFQKYFIEKKDKTYIIYAEKKTNLNYIKLVKLMDDFHSLTEFMPGYRDIHLKRDAQNRLITGIEFRPNFSPFQSLFTNEVEIYSDATMYVQCWKQLENTDSRIFFPNKNAPIINNGYWLIQPLNNNRVSIKYYLVVQPPVDIPLWLYKWIVKNVYVDVFESLIQECKSRK